LPQAVQEWATRYANAQKDLDRAIDDLLEAQNGFIDILLQVPFGEEVYDSLDDPQKSFITEWIKNSELFKIDPDSTKEELEKQLADNVDLVRSLVNIFANKEMQSVINSIDDLDKSDLSSRAYIDKVRQTSSAMWDAIGGEDNKYGFADKTDIEKIFGFDQESELKKWDAAITSIEGYLKANGVDINVSSLFNYHTMTREEMEAFFGIDWNAVGVENIKSADDVWNIIRNHIKKFDPPSIKTYSQLSSSVESFKAAQDQTNEILRNGVGVTQEYKDSLIELGISSKDLAECFDENNPLIVKNADGLKKLVEQTKNNTAQNIRLARSQARLKYVELAKDLNKIVGLNDKVSDSNMDVANSLLDQIDAVKLAIYKYEILEDQLLGVNNAFNKFAEAKEIDALNTYGDTYVEMAQTMYDALYKTGQVGTEQFWASVDALIPKDVYQKLTDDSDRMKAIYDYYNRYILPSLKLDEDSISLSDDALEEFVKKGLDRGIFEGDTKNFDLVEGMNLEKAAKLMGMTTTQAYALFAELDKFNASSTENSFLSQLDDSLEGRIVNVTNDLEDLNRQKIALFESDQMDELEMYGHGGNVDLTMRPVIDSSELINAGWEAQAGEMATVFTSTFSNEDGTVAINFTPIMVDDNGNYIGTLSPDELQSYAEKVIDGADDELGLQIGAKFEGENAISDAEMVAERIHVLHEDIYGDIDDINGKISENGSELRELGREAYDTWQKYTEVDSALTALEQIENKQKQITQEEANKLGIKWDDVAGKTVQQAIDYFLRQKTKLEEPTVVTAQLAVDEIDVQIAELKQKLESAETDVTVLGISADANQETIDAAKQNIQSQIQELEADKVNIATEFGIELSEEEKASVMEELTAVDEFEIHDKMFALTLEGAEQVMMTMKGINDYTLKNKSYTVTQYEQTVPVGGGLIGRLFGRAAANGTAYANGNFGAQKTETALVGELGPEMLVRNGRWTTIGDNGAEFTQVKKGDIIFNHKQTEDLLSKGHVAGRGKAYASGTAYSGLWRPTSPNASQSNKPGNDFTDAGNRLFDAADSISGASGSLSDSADEFREVFDWIEVRLEEINDDISLRDAQLENKVGHDAKNKTVDQIIDLNDKLYDNLIAGANKYYEYASRLLSKVPAEYRQAAQDGTIAIEEFVGEADEKTLEAIQEYREWVQKGDDAAIQAEETLTEISALARQAIDNISEDYDNKASLRDSKIDQLDAYNALSETTLGYESEDIYKAIIKENNQNIKTLQEQRDKMLKELNTQVEQGNIKKYSQDWYDAVNDISAVDTEIINLTTDTENYQDSINELHWDKFDDLMGRFESISDEIGNLVGILDTKDVVDELGNWTDEGITSLGLYAQQMEVAEVQAKKYKDEIDYLNKNWQKLGYTEQEYIEKLDELKSGQYDSIKLYNESKDSIVSLTEKLVEAIKKGIEKEIEAYEELIQKQKEALSSEKDMHDFQKSVMEQQKNISDIERKIAALSGDTSMSAAAKRKQLEADLAKAQYELEETYYDRSIENQQNALDKELEQFQEEKDEEIKGWEEYLENTEQVVADGLSTIQANTEAVYQTLQEVGEEYSLSISEALTSPWTYGSDAIQSYSEKFGITMSSTVEQLKSIASEFKTVMDEIGSYSNQVIDKVNNNAEKYTEAVQVVPDRRQEVITNPNVGSGGGGKPSNNASSNAGMISNISAWLKNGNTGSDVRKLQTALNNLGFNAGAVDGIFGYNTKQAVIRFQSSSKYGGAIPADGIVGPETKKKFKVAGYASGTTGVKKDQLAILDELGEELVIRPKNGRMSFMEKGTGVVPADLTSNLMSWGTLDPSDILERSRPVISAPHLVNNNIELNMEIAEVVHIDTVSNETIPNLTKTIEKQLDSYMKRLNGNIRKYTR
jgi:chromosome segregation ATPase